MSFVSTRELLSFDPRHVIIMIMIMIIIIIIKTIFIEDITS